MNGPEGYERQPQGTQNRWVRQEGSLTVIIWEMASRLDKFAFTVWEPTTIGQRIIKEATGFTSPQEASEAASEFILRLTVGYFQIAQAHKNF